MAVPGHVEAMMMVFTGPSNTEREQLGKVLKIPVH